MVTWNCAVKRELIVAGHCSADGIRGNGSFTEEVEVRAFAHLREVGSQTFEDWSNPAVRFKALAAGGGDRGHAYQQATEEQHEGNEHGNGDEKFCERKGGAMFHPISCGPARQTPQLPPPH